MTVGREGVRLCEWETYVLLRDGVGYFIEADCDSTQFATLRAIAAVGTKEPLALEQCSWRSHGGRVHRRLLNGFDYTAFPFELTGHASAGA
jgi:hypothetical protein